MLEALLQNKVSPGEKITEDDLRALRLIMASDLEAGSLASNFHIEGWSVCLLGFNYQSAKQLWISLGLAIDESLASKKFSGAVMTEIGKHIGWQDTTHEEFFLRCLTIRSGVKHASIKRWLSKAGK